MKCAFGQMTKRGNLSTVHCALAATTCSRNSRGTCRCRGPCPLCRAGAGIVARSDQGGLNTVTERALPVQAVGPLPSGSRLAKLPPRAYGSSWRRRDLSVRRIRIRSTGVWRMPGVPLPQASPGTWLSPPSASTLLPRFSLQGGGAVLDASTLAEDTSTVVLELSRPRNPTPYDRVVLPSSETFQWCASTGMEAAGGVLQPITTRKARCAMQHLVTST